MKIVITELFAGNSVTGYIMNQLMYEPDRDEIRIENALANIPVKVEFPKSILDEMSVQQLSAVFEDLMRIRMRVRDFEFTWVD